MFKLLRECLEINLNDYENINFNLEINKVILGVSFVIIIGIIMFNIYRVNIRMVVMQLTRHNANSEESAKTLSELGLDKSVIVRRLLLGNNALTKTVARVGERKYSYEEYIKLSKEEKAQSEKINFNTATFYIKEEEGYLTASIMEKYTTSLTRIVLACVFVEILCLCIIACMPDILNVVDNLLKSVKM